MKKIIVWLLAGLLLINLSSCEKNELPVFDLDTKPTLNIWFGTMATASNSTSDLLTDTVKHNLADQLPGVPEQIIFNVRLAGGMVTEHDRSFTLEVISGDVEKTFLEIGTFVLKGREYQASFPITFNLPVEGADDFTEPEHIVLKLKEGEFREGVIERSRLNIVVSNENTLTRPENWDVAFNMFSLPLSRYFGDYSLVKHIFIVRTIGRSLNFNVGIMPPMSDVTGMDNIPMFQVTAYQNACRFALFEYNEENPDNPLRDENNEPVVFP